MADPYDALAPHYRQYSARRSAYIASVDRYVLREAPKPARSLLDVGAGDGVRAMSLADALGAARVVLCEPSREMAARCRMLGAEVWETPAEALPATDERFDVVLCLWNVLGHLPDSRGRLAALSGMRRLLAPAGVLFIDVNNRHNAAAYGGLRVLARRLLDRVAFDERRGDAVYEWRIGERSFPGMGHLFTPAEIEGLLDAAGLQVVRRTAVDYATGACSDSPQRGQLLYQVRAQTA